MQDTPPVGGDTSWINLYGVYDSLSPTLQHVVSTLDLTLDLGEPFRLAVALDHTGTGVCLATATSDAPSSREPLSRLLRAVTARLVRVEQIQIDKAPPAR